MACGILSVQPFILLMWCSRISWAGHWSVASRTSASGATGRTVGAVSVVGVVILVVVHVLIAAVLRFSVRCCRCRMCRRRGTVMTRCIRLCKGGCACEEEADRRCHFN